jgi:hypothetical protein
MIDTADVYVFISGNPDVRGFSLERWGQNLPRLPDNSGWLPIAVASLTLANLERHALDPAIALLNLNTRGYHIARVSAEPTPFPHAFREIA